MSKISLAVVFEVVFYDSMFFVFVLCSIQEHDTDNVAWLIMDFFLWLYFIKSTRIGGRWRDWRGEAMGK